MDTLLLDLRYSLRGLRQRPAFALTAIASLALGIAVNTAVFSVVNGVLFKGVGGVTRTERLFQLTQDADGQWLDMSWPVVRHLREQPALVEDIAAFAVVPAAVAIGETPVAKGGLAVTANYFELLGVRAVRGRVFAADEALYPAVAPVALVSHDLWTREFGAAEDVVGRSVRVNGFPVTVIGVLAPGFAGHQTGLLLDVFLPLGLEAPGLPTASSLDDPQSSSLEVLARLPQGTAKHAAQSLSAAAGRFVPQGYKIRVESWGPLPGTIRGGAIAFLSLLSVLVALALTIACTNVTSMLLARSTERRREIAIRLTLGAGPGRLRRQLVTEALVLFVLAGLVGSTLAVWAAGLARLFSPRLPVPGRVGLDFGVDWRVMLFSLVITFGAGLVFSLIPALQAGRSSLAPALTGLGAGERQGTRLRGMLVGLQVAVSTLLLIAAGLLTGSLQRMRHLDPGWNPEGVQVVDLNLELRGATAEAGRAFYATLLDRAAAIPGVEAAALAAKLPLTGCSSFGPIIVPGVPPPPGRPGFEACLNRVSPGYFRVLELSLLRGRDFTAADDANGVPVAVVNQAMAGRLWPGADPIGREFAVNSRVRSTRFRVAGVVQNAKYRSLNEEISNFYYVPATQWHNSQMVLHVRATKGQAASVARALPQTVRAVDAHLPFESPRALTDALELHFLPQRVASWVAAVVGFFGLLLAAVGVYGVTALAVAGRTREVGVRMALGATPAGILNLILRQGAVAPGIGIVAGLALGVGFGQFASSVLSGVNPTDPLAIAGVPLVVGAVAGVAVLIPASRMLRGDPAAALRHD
jgi:predicted permease